MKKNLDNNRTIKLITDYIDEMTPSYGTSDNGNVMLYDSNNKCIVFYSENTSTVWGDSEGLVNKIYTMFGSWALDDVKEALKLVIKRNFPDVIIKDAGVANIG